MSRATERHHLPRETFRDWLNEFRQDLKYRYMPFRAYYRLRAQKYMRFKDRELRLLRHLVPAGKDSLDIGANLGTVTLSARTWAPTSRLAPLLDQPRGPFGTTSSASPQRSLTAISSKVTLRSITDRKLRSGYGFGSNA